MPATCIVISEYLYFILTFKITLFEGNGYSTISIVKKNVIHLLEVVVAL